MKLDRAKEIIAAPERIHVTYQNIPVWLNQITADNRVEINDLNSNNQLVVPVTDLMEVGTLENHD